MTARDDRIAAVRQSTFLVDDEPPRLVPGRDNSSRLHDDVGAPLERPAQYGVANVCRHAARRARVRLASARFEHVPAGSRSPPNSILVLRSTHAPGVGAIGIAECRPIDSFAAVLQRVTDRRTRVRPRVIARF